MLSAGGGPGGHGERLSPRAPHRGEQGADVSLPCHGTSHQDSEGF